jgi:hypothetical protein
VLFTHAGQPLLNTAREFLLPRKLNFRILLGHPNRAVAGDFRRLDARTTHFLSPRDVGASEGVRTKAWEITALGRGSPLQGLSHAGIPQREAAAVRPSEHPAVGSCLICGGFRAVTVTQVSQRERSLAGLRFWIVDVTAPVALHNLDDTVLKIYAASRKSKDFRDACTRSNCSFNDEQVGIVQPREHSHGFLFRQNPLRSHTPL